MKNVGLTLRSVLAVILCLCLLSAFSACSEEETDNNSSVQSQPVETLKNEFKYSKDCVNWTEVTDSDALFRADGKYAAGDTEVVYLHIKNLDTADMNYKVTLSVASGNAGGAQFGYAFGVRSAFADNTKALEAVKDRAVAVSPGYVLSETLKADSAVTFALIIFVPADGAAAEMKLNLDFKVLSVDTSGMDNISKTVDGKTVVYANTYKIVESKTVDTVLTNSDSSFKVAFKAGALPQGALVTAKVTPTETAGAYSIKIAVDGVGFTGNAKVSLLAGYGFKTAELYIGETKLSSSYSTYGGMVEADFTANGTYIVKTDGAVQLNGVAVDGYDGIFDRFDKAVKYVNGLSADEVGETVNYIIFGKVNYLVAEGEEISYTADHSQIKSVNIIGGNVDAELVLDANSGSLPSLPYAEEGVQITYSRMKFDSDKTTDIKHFDYRGNADISFKGCTFEQGIATRGPSSNVVVDGCAFNCTAQSDTFKGYCYYSVSVIGANKITVQFTNNNVTGSWGGINLDWAAADFIVTGNTFSNITCSKPAIQLSRANTMLIENNKFTNIKDENAFRFYSDYGASSTTIKNNFIDADYIFQSDRDGAISDYTDFVFEGNTITSTTSLTMGHKANAPADQVYAHGYVIDTTVNIIQ